MEPDNKIGPREGLADVIRIVIFMLGVMAPTAVGSMARCGKMKSLQTNPLLYEQTLR
jgi:hypothetical protein